MRELNWRVGRLRGDGALEWTPIATVGMMTGLRGEPEWGPKRVTKGDMTCVRQVGSTTIREQFSRWNGRNV
jgi:hypothetical protein